MKHLLVATAFAGAFGAAAPAFATGDHGCTKNCGGTTTPPVTQPAGNTTVDVNNAVGVNNSVKVPVTVSGQNTLTGTIKGNNELNVGAGALSPTANGGTAAANNSIAEGALSPSATANSGSKSSVGNVTQNTVYERPTPMAYSPTVAPAAAVGCFGAKWAVSVGASTPGGAGSAGFTPSQEWNADCDESNDRRQMIGSPDSFANGIGVAASVEKFDGIKNGFDRMDTAIKTNYGDGTKRLPTSGVGMLFGIAGTPAVQPVAPNITQTVIVDKNGNATPVICPEGTKFNVQTMKCERN